VRIDAERNLLFVRGSVPGPMNGLVTVAKQGGRAAMIEAPHYSAAAPAKKAVRCPRRCSTAR